jgi:hypothetical protein
MFFTFAILAGCNEPTQGKTPTTGGTYDGVENVCSISVGNFQHRPFRRLQHTWEDNI